MTKLDQVLVMITGLILSVALIIFVAASFVEPRVTKEVPETPSEDVTTVADNTTEVDNEPTIDTFVDTEVKEFGISEEAVLNSKAYRKVVDKYVWYMLSEPILYDVVKQENRSVFTFRYSFSHAEFRIVAKYKNDNLKFSAPDLVNFMDESYPIIYWDMGSIPEDFTRVYDKAAELGYTGVYRCDATNMDNVILQSSNTDYVTLDCSR